MISATTPINIPECTGEAYVSCGNDGYFVCVYNEAADGYTTACSDDPSLISHIEDLLDYCGRCEPYDDGNHGGFSEEEYEELVNQRRAVISYWTPGRIWMAVPLHNKRVDISSVPMKMIATETKEDGLFGRRKQRNLQAITNDEWNHGGDVVEAMGILLFTKGGINRRCSATAITDDSTDGRSLILTAAHCVYDDNANSVSSCDSMNAFAILLSISLPNSLFFLNLYSFIPTLCSFQIKMRVALTNPVGTVTTMPPLGAGRLNLLSSIMIGPSIPCQPIFHGTMHLWL